MSFNSYDACEEREKHIIGMFSFAYYVKRLFLNNQKQLNNLYKFNAKCEI